MIFFCEADAKAASRLLQHGAWLTHFCIMKITQDVRDYAAAQGISDKAALTKGMETKSIEFVKQGAKVYRKL